MAQGNPGAQALAAALANRPSLDANAVMAVARQEGLGGGIGDNGTSFGPFQLHYGGAYPSSAPHGAQASQAWAWSPAGLNYALNQISQVAAGLKGRAAINAIVSRFERPANPAREIAGALAAYGAPLPVSQSGTVPAGRRQATTTAGSTVAPPNLAAIQRDLAILGLPGFLAGAVRQQAAPMASPALTAPVPAVGPVNLPGAKYERVDQGVDFNASAPVRAFAPGFVESLTKGMAGGTGDIIKIKLDHPVHVHGHTYDHIYYSEERPLVRQGQHVNAGMPVMGAGGNELGFLDSTGHMAPLVGGLGAGTQPTQMGQDFLSYLRSLGVRA